MDEIVLFFENVFYRCTTVPFSASTVPVSSRVLREVSQGGALRPLFQPLCQVSVRLQAIFESVRRVDPDRPDGTRTPQCSPRTTRTSFGFGVSRHQTFTQINMCLVKATTVLLRGRWLSWTIQKRFPPGPLVVVPVVGRRLNDGLACFWMKVFSKLDESVPFGLSNSFTEKGRSVSR